MKIILYALFIILVATSCSNETEKVIKRHPGGEEKVVAYYKEYGANKQLIRKLTYDRYGELILKEDLLKNERLDYLQLHPELKSPSGLEDYLQGEWVLDIDRGRWIGHKKGEAKVSGSKLTYKHETWLSSEMGKAEIRYLPMYRIMLSEATNKDISWKILPLQIKSPRAFSYAGEDVSVKFFGREKSNVLDNLLGKVLIVVTLGITLLFISTPTRYNNSLDELGGVIKTIIALTICIAVLSKIMEEYF